MKLNHIISTQQFLDKNYLAKLFKSTQKLEGLDKLNKIPQVLKNKLVATIFYEPSTRTRLSFEAAVQKLGGMILSTESAGQFSSAIKGETLEDTIRIISGYVQIIVLRHPEAGAAETAAKVSEVPIINAGDGKGEHPTQALLDLYTIQKEKGQIDQLKIGLVGDLLNGRTIHSLLHLLSLYKDVTLYLISPEQLRLEQAYLKQLTEKSVKYEQLDNLSNVLDQLDVIYMTRVQKERFTDQTEYEKLKDYFILGEPQLKRLKKGAIIMHPLPRVKEIDPCIDADPRATYFRQAKNGLYVRMSLLSELVDKGFSIDK